jgi:hypothetical protein
MILTAEVVFINEVLFLRKTEVRVATAVSLLLEGMH